MEGIIRITLFIVLPIVVFVAYFGRILFDKQKIREKDGVIIMIIAMIVFLAGVITPLSQLLSITIVYVLFILQGVRNKNSKKKLLMLLIMVISMVCATSDTCIWTYACEVDEYERASELLKNKYGMDDFLVLKLGEERVLEIARTVEKTLIV